MNYTLDWLKQRTQELQQGIERELNYYTAATGIVPEVRIEYHDCFGIPTKPVVHIKVVIE